MLTPLIEDTILAVEVPEYSYDSIKHAIMQLHLDRRKRWVNVNGELATPGKALMECSGCDGRGCRECGGKKKTYRYFPIFHIKNGTTIKIKEP